MKDISNLYGITLEEADKLRRADIRTVEDFIAFVKLGDSHFAYRIAVLSNMTGIWKPERLIELIPAKHLPAKQLPQIWIDALMPRLLDEAKPEEPWLKRCRSGFQRWRLNLKGHWLSWKDNLPLLLLGAAAVLLMALALRGIGLLKNLPEPFGLRNRVLVTARDLKEGQVLKADDFYSALLSPKDEYFKLTDHLEGFKLSRSLSSQRPLRHRDVVRLQVLAKIDILAGALIKAEDVEAKWTIYQPDVLVDVKQVANSKARYNIQQGTVIPCVLIDPDPCAAP